MSALLGHLCRRCRLTCGSLCFSHSDLRAFSRVWQSTRTAHQIYTAIASRQAGAPERSLYRGRFSSLGELANLPPQTDARAAAGADHDLPALNRALVHHLASAALGDRSVTSAWHDAFSAYLADLDASVPACHSDASAATAATLCLLVLATVWRALPQPAREGAPVIADRWLLSLRSAWAHVVPTVTTDVDATLAAATAEAWTNLSRPRTVPAPRPRSRPHRRIVSNRGQEPGPAQAA